MADKPTGNSFGTFLETLQQNHTGESAASGEKLKLLSLLLNSDAHTVPELQQESGMAFTNFAEALNATQAAGFTTLSGPPGREVVELTKLGEQIAHLER
jgi:hypothetical protein